MWAFGTQCSNSVLKAACQNQIAKWHKNVICTSFLFGSLACNLFGLDLPVFFNLWVSKVSYKLLTTNL